MPRFQPEQNIHAPVQSINIVNPVPESITPNQEGNTLIWLDECLKSEDQDVLKTKHMLRSVNDYTLLFDDGGKCLEYIQSNGNDNIFMIVSGKSSNEFLPRLQNLNQVKAIYIFCMNKNLYQSLRNDYKKVIDVCTEQEELVKCLQETIHSFSNNASLIKLLNDTSKQKTHLTATDAYNFKKQQIIKDIILRMPETEDSKQKLVNYCRSYYKGNQSVLEKVNEFDEHYEPTFHAIFLYTRESFLYRIINNAFRTRNVELLEIFHYYITDLSKSLEYEAKELKKKLSTSDQKMLSLYRGHQFSHEEYEDFILSCGYVVFNSYLSTSSNIEVVNFLAGFSGDKVPENSDIIRVLFHIEIDVKSLTNSNVILADISKHSNFEEECEYLFDIGATFEVIDIDRENKTVKMVVSDRPYHLSWMQLNLAYLYRYASKEIINMMPDDSPFPPPGDYVEYLLHIDTNFKRLDAFEAYILKTPLNNENYQEGSKYCIEGHNLRRTDHRHLIRHGILDANTPFTDEYTDTYNQAMKYFQAFYDCAADDSIQCSLRALGFTNYKIGNYEQSQKDFIKASEMSNDPLNLATCYHFLGCIHGRLFNHVESMNYFTKVLQMRGSIELSFIAATYCQMAMLENRRNGKEYYLKALDIYQQINEELSILKCRSELLNLGNEAPIIDDCVKILDLYFKYCQDYQIISPHVAELYTIIGYEYFRYLDYDRALECYLKMLCFFNNVSDHEIIAEIYIRKKDSKSAIEYLEKILKLTENLPKIVNCHILMGTEYAKQNNFDKALECLKQSVSICNQSDSNIEFKDYIFDFELQRKSQITTCKSFSNLPNHKSRTLYYYNKALNFSLDFPKLFQSEIICLFELIDHVLKLDYSKELKYLLEEANNNNETRLIKFILETSFDIYIIIGDYDDAKNLFYYMKALEIYHNRKKIIIDRNIEVMCKSKIKNILGSNDEYDELIKDFHKFFQVPNNQLETIETQEERNLFNINYFLELKRNQFAKIYSSMGDVYLKSKTYEQAQLYYDKSIDYYKTFPSLFHLELADLYSKKDYIIHTQREKQILTNDNIVPDITALALFKKSVTVIKYERDV